MSARARPVYRGTAPPPNGFFVIRLYDLFPDHVPVLVAAPPRGLTALLIVFSLRDASAMVGA
ncbi:hypothetical protein CFP66_08480 [Pseudonocardia sp. MH-G8]|nr:hypothetical protein CFP66_08480 [Pseudonocardia sp. MH-G8]